MMDSQMAPGASYPASTVQASKVIDGYQAALAYHKAGLCVIPLNGKRPALEAWKFYQTRWPSEADLQRWQSKKLLKNIGVVCGAVSKNLVVLDFGGLGRLCGVCRGFPTLAQSCTVATGSGKGKHVNLYADTLPPTTRVLDTSVGATSSCRPRAATWPPHLRGTPSRGGSTMSRKHSIA